MTEQLLEIGGRLSALREITELTASQMAEKMDMDEHEYTAYETGQRDFSFSFLHNAANILGVDVLDIISGESPKLSVCTLVRDGKGYDIIRREAYGYKHLAFTFRNKKSEPFLVTVEPTVESDVESGSPKEPTLHSHVGQEFNYMLSGAMRLHLGDVVYELNQGDSVYYDSGVPHAMKAIGNEPAKFLAVVIN